MDFTRRRSHMGQDPTTEQKAPESLKDHLQAVLDSMASLAWSVLPDGSLELCNQHWVEYTGLPSGDTVGAPWAQIVHTDDVPGLMNYWTSQELGDIEVRLRRYDGSYRLFRIRRSGVKVSGSLTRWFGTANAIDGIEANQRGTATSAKASHGETVGPSRSEGGVSAREHDLKLIVDTIPTLSWSTAPDGSVDFVSQGWLNFTGLSAEEAQGFGWAAAIHPDDAEDLLTRWQAALISGTPVEIEARIRRFDGAYRWFLFRTNPLRDESGMIVKWYGTNTDIHDRRIAEDALQASERTLRANEDTLRDSELNLRQLTETIPAMVWSASPDGAITYCNSRFLEYTGFSADEVTRDGWQNTIHPEDAARVFPVWMSCARTGAPYRVEVRTLHVADHTYRWCLVNALPLLDAEGQIIKWYGTILDIHDWKQAQEQLRTTQAELAHMTRVMTMGEITASIAHEVSQPLAAAVASSDSCVAWLTKSPPNVAKARSAADRVVQAVTQASSVLQRIRTMFKKAPATQTRFEINDVIGEVISLVQPEFTSKRIALRTDLKESLPTVFCDRVQITQVILNLVINGIEATSRVKAGTRKILIQSAGEQDEIRVLIADSGPGLDPDVVSRLFSPFVTTKADGIGMGLSISKSIVEAHGGRLWAAANEPEGAIFQFVLPVGSVQ